MHRHDALGATMLAAVAASSCALATGVNDFTYSDAVGDWVSTSANAAGTMTLHGDKTGEVAVNLDIASIVGYREFSAHWADLPPDSYSIALECTANCGDLLGVSPTLTCMPANDAMALSCQLHQGAASADVLWLRAAE